MEEKNLNQKYEDLSCLLLYFLEDLEVLSADELNDYNTIKRFVKTFSKGMVRNTLNEGHEVLSLRDFPGDWIRKTSNRYFENESARKEWVKWIVEMLEQEARKQGKIEDHETRKANKMEASRSGR